MLINKNQTTHEKPLYLMLLYFSYPNNPFQLLKFYLINYYIYDDFYNGYLDLEAEDRMYEARGTGELHVMGNIYCSGGEDNYGIYPHMCNYGTIGSANRYWWNIYSANFYAMNNIYEAGSTLSSKYAAKTYEGKAKIGSTAYTFQTTTTTTYTGAANYITFIL